MMDGDEPVYGNTGEIMTKPRGESNPTYQDSDAVSKHSHESELSFKVNNPIINRMMEMKKKSTTVNTEPTKTVITQNQATTTLTVKYQLYNRFIYEFSL